MGLIFCKKICEVLYNTLSSNHNIIRGQVTTVPPVICFYGKSSLSILKCPYDLIKVSTASFLHTVPNVKSFPLSLLS